MQIVDNEIAIRSRYLDTVIAGDSRARVLEIGPTSIAQNRTRPWVSGAARAEAVNIAGTRERAR